MTTTMKAETETAVVLVSLARVALQEMEKSYYTQALFGLHTTPLQQLCFFFPYFTLGKQKRTWSYAPNNN